MSDQVPHLPGKLRKLDINVKLYDEINIPRSGVAALQPPKSMGYGGYGIEFVTQNHAASQPRACGAFLLPGLVALEALSFAF